MAVIDFRVVPGRERDMGFCSICNRGHNAGFISTRLAGTDAVSLETAKWAEIFEKEGFTCHYFAGELDRPPECSYLASEAHFKHPEIRDVFRTSFGVTRRERRTTEKIHALKEVLKTHIYTFIEKFRIDLLVPENALTIPLNIPLGIALTEVISETGIPAISHHHDFFWERMEFLTNAVWEYLNMAFPPNLPSIRHVVLNSSADNQLSLRTGISSTIIPNVMDFDAPHPNTPIRLDETGDVTLKKGPVRMDEYVSDARRDLGVADDGLFILQPTRVVKRKGVEHAIELVNRLGRKARLVISRASGDVEYGYEQKVRQYSELMNVDTVFVYDIIGKLRGKTKSGKKIYTLPDIYPHADLVTYPSNFEGFGNAFLEAIYFCKPVVINTYSIYAMDIKPKDFRVIEIDGFVSDETVEQTRRVLDDPALRDRIVLHNYKTAREHYSYSVLKRSLGGIIADCMDCKG